MRPNVKYQVLKLSFLILGKSLKDMEESLSSYGIKEGCKLMMIGKRVKHIYTCATSLVPEYVHLQNTVIISKQNSPEEEAELRKLKDIEKCVEQMAKKLEKVDGELTGLKNVSNHRSFCFLIIYREKNYTALFCPIF